MPCIRNSGSDHSHFRRAASERPIQRPFLVPTSSTVSVICVSSVGASVLTRQKRDLQHGQNSSRPAAADGQRVPARARSYVPYH